MLRLNTYSSVIPKPHRFKTGSSCSSWTVHYNRNEILSGRITIRALKDDTNGGTTGLPGWDPGLEVEVPFEQRPILARDRLLGSYKVKPVINLLKQTLVGTGALLVGAALLFIFATPVEEFIQNIFLTKENSSKVSASQMSTNFNIRKEELLQLPAEVMADDNLAAADGRPVYCRDRYYRALAGGQYCKWEDLLK